MSQDAEQPSWWELHLRKVRGEGLPETEQRRYEEEMARQDREAPLKSDIETLKKVRATSTALAQENAQLRTRIERLEQEIEVIERGLSPHTRQLLGMQE